MLCPDKSVFLRLTYERKKIIVRFILFTHQILIGFSNLHKKVIGHVLIVSVLHLRLWLPCTLMKGLFLCIKYSENTVIISLKISLKVIVKVKVTVGSFKSRRIVSGFEVCWSPNTCFLIQLKHVKFQFTLN